MVRTVKNTIRTDSGSIFKNDDVILTLDNVELKGTIVEIGNGYIIFSCEDVLSDKKIEVPISVGDIQRINKII